MTLELSVLFEDEDHGVALKLAGMSCHGKGPHTLVSALQRKAGSTSAAPWHPVHRLDFGTRGPVLFAKHPEAFRRLQAQWTETHKTYHAWVAHRLQTPQGIAQFPLEGKASRTEFACLGHRPWGVHGEASLVEWTLISGRTHQIRRHASAMGHPIVGDAVYAAPPIYTGHGIHLVCTELRWTHPYSGIQQFVTVEPSKKMRRVVESDFVPNHPSPFLSLFHSS